MADCSMGFNGSIETRETVIGRVSLKKISFVMKVKGYFEMAHIAQLAWSQAEVKEGTVELPRIDDTSSKAWP